MTWLKQFKLSTVQAVQQSVITQCRCNGVSGSCSLKTCWSTLPTFRSIGDTLCARYRTRARRVQPVLPDRSSSPHHLRLCRRYSTIDGRNTGVAEVKKPRKSDLVYTVRSPDYCDYDPESGTPGTAGRHCHHGNGVRGGEGSCEHLCCGRGFTTTRYTRTWQCYCKFHWCCNVTCRKCTELTDKRTCNGGVSLPWQRKLMTSLLRKRENCT